jgi:two-component sensor histidine kinase
MCGKLRVSINHFRLSQSLILAIMLCFYWLSTVKAQPLSFIPDSSKLAFSRFPESMHDSLYAEIGDAFYAQFTNEGFNKALDCFTEGLRLAEKYKHTALIQGLNYHIGAVYDAEGNQPEKILYYYKKNYELLGSRPDITQMQYVYCLAHAYNLMHDSVNSMRYINIITKDYRAFFEREPGSFARVDLLVTYLTMKNNNIRDFITHFEALDTSFQYQNGRFPYGRYFAVCSWRYAFEKGNYDKAIETIKAELINSPTDSSLLMNYLARAYAHSNNYQNAYEWADKLNTYDATHIKESLRKDLKVKLLQTDNVLKEKETELKNKQNTFLLIGFIATLLLMSIALYFWRANYKNNKILAERNAEKIVLINEIHHRVKNNLQLLYSLAKLQLPTIKDKNAKALWQKHLSQLNAMSLVNEKLYVHEGASAISLKTFIGDISQHFGQIFPVEHPLSIEAQIEENLVINADFAVSFGLIFSELMTNSYKYAFPNTDKPRVSILIEQGNNKEIIFNYTDFSELIDPTLFQTKQTGGIALIKDLTRQLKGELIINNKPFLEYKFIFN